MIPEFKRPKIKAVLPAIVLLTSFYYSATFAGGILIGYLLSRLFCHFFVHNGKVDMIFIDWGNWQIHLHHWIMGFFLLAGLWVIDHYYLPTFFAGAIIGVIIQDIYDYNDWHKVIIRNTAKENIKN